MTLRVSPRVASAPATIVVRVTVEPDEGNRRLEISLDSEAFYRSTELPLEGDRGPRTTQVEFRDVPGGAYRVQAIVSGATKHVLYAKADVIVNGGAEW
jgi:hypothetical protein